jgi:hypothetical protein
MITQQAKDHAQACYDATKEAAILTHMGDAQKAAYMTILANHKPRPVHIPAPSATLGPRVPKPCPTLTEPHNRKHDCQCANCTRARSIRPLVGGYQPCSGYEPLVKGSSWMVWVLAASLIIVPVAVAFMMGVTQWQN